jgi:MYXO-CTERM domain-containing protein
MCLSGTVFAGVQTEELVMNVESSLMGTVWTYGSDIAAQNGEIVNLESYDFGDFSVSGSNIQSITKSVIVQTGATAAQNITMDYTLVWDTDPFVVNAFSMTNNTGVDQVFTIDASALVNPSILGGTSHRGQVGGSVTDANNDGIGGAAVAPGTNLYEAFVDGVSAKTMLDDSNSYGFSGVGGTTGIGPGSFGPEAGPLNAISDLKLTYTFFLAAGDSISLNGFYFIESDPIPAPAALGLLGIAGLAGRRRRRG